MSRQYTQVGPFLDPTNSTTNSSPDFSAEALKSQYSSVFSDPRPAWTVTNTRGHFRAEEGDGSLNDFEFCPEDIEKACAELKGTAAAGPDGVPATMLKNCR